MLAVVVLFGVGGSAKVTAVLVVVSPSLRSRGFLGASHPGNLPNFDNCITLFSPQLTPF
jgi:hypothetical protein